MKFKIILKFFLKRFPFIYRNINLFLRKKKINNPDAYPNWSKFFSNSQIDNFSDLRLKPKSNKKILIATGAVTHLACTTVESLIASSLKIRGVETHILLNDDALPACIECTHNVFGDAKYFVKHGSSVLLDDCWLPGKKAFEETGSIIHKYSDFLNNDDQLKANEISDSLTYIEIEEYKLDGLSIGEHAKAGTLRFFARGSIKNELYGEEVLRKYFIAALLTLFALRKLFRKNNFESIVLNHGIYIPQGIVIQAAREAGIRVITWNPGYRKQRFIFSHYDSYHHTLISESISKWKYMKWNKKIETEILRYLKTRRLGTEDWIWFHKTPNFHIPNIKKKLSSKIIVCALTSVMWDAQLHYKSNAFEDMLEWIFQTIEYFQNRKEIELIIRVHPAEVNGALPSRQKMENEIRKRYPKLGKNITIIPPESNISTYAITDISNAVIIYNTKTGIELSSLGIPVIVAGEAWIRNKGFSFDVNSRHKYFDMLDKIPFKKRMSVNNIQNALKYAFHFFYRRMIPIKAIKSVPNQWPPYKVEISEVMDLQVGKDPGLDLICNGIISGTDFIYKEEDLL